MTEKYPNSSILIVDDEESVGITLLKILEKSGYEVRWVGSGKEALSIMTNGNSPSQVKVMLIDIRMPDMNGVHLLKEVKKMVPDVGAIMMTGNADIETAVESLNEGAFAYIQKPYNVDEVRSFIEKILEKHKLVGENKELMQRLREWNLELEKTVQEKTSELKSKNLILLEVVEKLKALNEIKSRFVANASHELQTPVTSILGFSSMLLDYWDKLDKVQVFKFLKIIRDESQRITRSSRDLLDLSHIQDGKMDIEYKKIDLQAIADRVILNMKVIKSNVKVNCSFEKGSREIVSDEDKIQQVFTNLIGNALKYSHKGGEVRVVCKRKDDVVVVNVIDEGPGISLDKREKIFEPFYRIHDEASKKTQGTGLGLSIAKAIVEALGGNIRVGGEPGKGSNFTFFLPREAPKEERFPSRNESNS